jgi:hypothetical protein
VLRVAVGDTDILFPVIREAGEKTKCKLVPVVRRSFVLSLKSREKEGIGLG